MTEGANKTQPVDRVRVGAIEAAIWRNESKEGHVFYNATIKRRYTVDDKPKATNSFGRDDLPLAAKVLDLTYSRIAELQAADGAQQLLQQATA